MKDPAWRKDLCTINNFIACVMGCKYRVVIVPKCRKKRLLGKFQRAGGQIITELCYQKRVELAACLLLPDHICVCLGVAPKFSIALKIDFMKGKSAIRIQGKILKVRSVIGLHFRAKGYGTHTVDLEEKTIRKYTRDR